MENEIFYMNVKVEMLGNADQNQVIKEIQEAINEKGLQFSKLTLEAIEDEEDQN